MNEAARSCLVAGVGPKLGLALARRFAEGGFAVAMAARDGDKLSGYAAEAPDRLFPHPTDLSNPDEARALVEAVEREHGPLGVMIANVGAFVRGPVAETDPADFARVWQTGCLAGFALAHKAAQLMLPRGQGTILFTGATASLRGGANFVNLAAPKAALRAVAQSLAREVGPQGIHVGHVVIDGGIGENEEDSRLRPEAVAEAYWFLHSQHRSAWTFELDLRPWVETW